MPSHVFTRLGHWEESVSSNRASAEIAKKELASPDPKLMAPEALHAYDYMVYAHLQLGQEDAARRVVDEIKAGDKVDAGNHLAASFALAAMPARYALERHRWEEAARLRCRRSPASRGRAYRNPSHRALRPSLGRGAQRRRRDREGGRRALEAAARRPGRDEAGLLGRSGRHPGKGGAAWIALAEAARTRRSPDARSGRP
jgi:hypothetical protein